jgi:ABC-type transport system substrate-binding protein
MRAKKHVKLVVGVAAVALLATGCGTKTDTSSEQAGGSLVTNIGEPERLITTFANEAQGISVLHALFKGLIDYDATSREPVNVVASSITSPDQKVWTIKIKKGFTFDNGEPVNSDSFIRAWNYGAYAPNAQDNSHFYDKIVGYDDLQTVDPDDDGPLKAPDPKSKELSGLRKVDDQTFVVTLKEPFSVFPTMLGYNAFYPMAKACYDDIKACNEKPIGDGPFKMDGPWQHSQQIKLVRSDSYAGSKAKLDRLTFRIYDKIDTAYLDMNAGELDVLYAVPASKFKEAVAKFGDNMIRQPSAEFNYLSVPYYVPELRDPKIRQAISMAIDRQPIIDALFNGQFTPAKSVISPVVPGSRTDACQACVYAPDKAKALLAEAGGWPAGKKLELWCNGGGGHEKWLQAVGDQLKKNLGIDYEIHCDLQFAQYLGKLDHRAVTGPFRLRWAMDYPSTEDYIRPLYTKGAPGNFVDYENDQVDDLVHQGDLANDEGKRLKLYQRAEDLVLNDLPVIPLWFGVTSVVKGEKVDHITVNPTTGIEWANLTAKK